jgi:hypothetical protein
MVVNNISFISWRSVLLVKETIDLSQVIEKNDITKCCIEYTSFERDSNSQR